MRKHNPKPINRKSKKKWQQDVKKHWEKKFSKEPTANLFPSPPASVISSCSSHRRSPCSLCSTGCNSLCGEYNADDVDFGSMGEIQDIKKYWEIRMNEEEVKKQSTPSPAKSSTNLCPTAKTSLPREKLFQYANVSKNVTSQECSPAVESRSPPTTINHKNLSGSSSPSPFKVHVASPSRVKGQKNHLQIDISNEIKQLELRERQLREDRNKQFGEYNNSNKDNTNQNNNNNNNNNKSISNTVANIGTIQGLLDFSNKPMDVKNSTTHKLKKETYIHNIVTPERCKQSPTDRSITCDRILSEMKENADRETELREIHSQISLNSIQLNTSK